MSKIKWEFNIPEEREEFELCKEGVHFHTVINNIMNYLKNESKYNDNLDEKEIQMVDSVREKIVDILAENEVENYF